MAEEDVDIYNMTDEEIMGMSSPPDPSESSTDDITEDTNTVGENEHTNEDEHENNAVSSSSESDLESTTLVDSKQTEEEQESTSQLSDEQVSANDDHKGASDVFSGDNSVNEGDSPTKSRKDPTDTPVDNEVDYKAEYERIFAPFKANGEDVRAENVDQVIRLMQMGAGYNAKISKLKPSLKIIKMLEANDLLDEGKLNYLIDLDKKNPDAVNKFVQESGVDPLDLDDKPVDYTPNSYAIDDKQVEVDMVLAEIENTPGYSQTLDVIANQWDDVSRQQLFENPADIRNINNQISSGVFKQITDVVKHQRMLGNFNGISDIDAYRTVGVHMQQQGMLIGQQNQQQQGSSQVAQNQSVNQQEVVPVHAQNQGTNENSKLRDRKKAAANTRTKPATPKKEIDFSSMSDEEFEKLSLHRI